MLDEIMLKVSKPRILIRSHHMGSIYQWPMVPATTNWIMICLNRRELWFSKCLHLRNPWNDNKEVKICRDGQVRQL